MRTLAVLFIAACSTPPAEIEPDATPPDAAVEISGVFDPTGAPTDPMSKHLQLGIPVDDSPADDYLLIHDQFAESYNHDHNSANWVSYLTTPSDFGPAERYAGPFYPDTTLPADWFHPDTDEYNRSGYDRGHMLRSEERTQTEDQNIQTFVISNVVPQTPDLNRGVWFDFEKYVQYKVQLYGKQMDAYELSGPVLPAPCMTHLPRTANDGCNDLGATTDPTQRIPIPTHTWKVVVFVPTGEPLATATDHQIEAVLMPNIAGIENDSWSKYKTTVAAIEAATGYTFPSLH
ncbi:MAG: DNA/RNA non-specific endonuclease [Kofleriaceae bacterium]